MAHQRRVIERIERSLGAAPASLSPLSGGCVGEVYAGTLSNGTRIVVKVDAGATPTLDVEGFMLTYLRERSELPVPSVLASEPDLLVMEFVEGRTSFDERAERHAGELLAALHDIAPDGPPRFGFERDTLIGSLTQPNAWCDTWGEFFAQHRLLDTGGRAHDAGSLPSGTMKRLEALASRIGELVPDDRDPSLIHGDVWSGNVHAQDGRITGFIDPAIYFADSEIELAFICLFSCFGRAFFDAYAERRPIDDGFFRTRRDLYNLFPLLVHARLFGGGYGSSVVATLARLGF